MQKLTPALLLAALAFAACGGSPTPPAPDADTFNETEALTLASQTVKVSPSQARALGLTGQTTSPGPLAVTVAVKIAKPGTRYAGQKRASASWKVAQTGESGGSYALALTDSAGAVLKPKTGSVSVTLPLPSGREATTRSRSTGYVPTAVPACATLSYSWTGSAGTFGTGAAPLQVCEAGVTPPAAASLASPTLDAVSLRTWFSPAYGEMNAFAGLSNVPTGAAVATRFTFRDAEECGAGDRYGVDGSGEWTKTSGSDAGQPVYRVPIDEQSMVQGQGLEYLFTLTLEGKTREFAGVLCYRATQAE